LLPARQKPEAILDVPPLLPFVPVAMDDRLNLEETELSYHTEKFIWKKHSNPNKKEKFHLIWPGIQGERN
jgi:hypothetical protein